MTLFYQKPNDASCPKYEKPDVCPHCHRVTACSYISMTALSVDGGTLTFIKYQCQCEKFITCTYFVPNNSSYKTTVRPINTFPNGEISIKEAEKLEIFSPQFVKIYSEVMKAKHQGLYLLVGPGLRKAIEYLVKDYLLYTNILSEEKLKKIALRKCIADFIQNEDLLAVMGATVEIGNDEVH